jgi:NADH dehydrogenase
MRRCRSGTDFALLATMPASNDATTPASEGVPRPRVVIVGAGFGGLEAARALRREPVLVQLVDQHNYHTFQPLLYQVATAGLEPEEIAHAVRAIFHDQENFRFRMGRVTGIDWDARVVRFASGPPLSYDRLVLALGTTTADFGIRGVAEHAFALKCLADAINLRSHVLAQFEEAARDPSAIEGGALVFVIVGGGPTGVEMAGALVELFDVVLRRDHPALDIARAHVMLVERDRRVLGQYTERSQRYAQRQLEKRGVELRLGTSVTEVRADAIVLEGGETLRTRTVIWAAGVRAHPLADGLGLEQTRGGRIAVGPDLSVPGRPEVFVIGDLAASLDREGHPYPQLAPVAQAAGGDVARAIGGRLRGESVEPFVYHDRGTMATIGRNSAVAELRGGIRARGFLAWLMWLALHLVQLVGFRNRINVLINWTWNYFTWDRSARLILDLQLEGAPAAIPVEAPERAPLEGADPKSDGRDGATNDGKAGGKTDDASGADAPSRDTGAKPDPAAPARRTS